MADFLSGAVVGGPWQVQAARGGAWMSTSTVRVVFRNQCGAPVTVIVNGYTNEVAMLVCSGVVTGLSGVFQVSGYSSYACSAYAPKMMTSGLVDNTGVAIVFESSKDEP